MSAADLLVWWHCVVAVARDWQTLIAGFLGLVGGVVAYVGALRAAKRQVAAAQHETEVMRDKERKRIAREGFAFHAMLGAAMGALIEDISASRAIGTLPPSARYTGMAYDVSQYVKQRAGFAELRAAFLHHGGSTLTDTFLQLDKEIENFDGISEQLDHIEKQAMMLQFEAENRKKINLGVLGDDLA